MPDMTYRSVGRSGLVVSTLGLGANNFGWRTDNKQTRKVVDAALDRGITLVDTSDNYGIWIGDTGASERQLGEILKGRRGDVVLATKFGSDLKGLNGRDFGARGSRRYIRRALESSLARLQTDYIDLYQYHRPDNLTPIEETLDALHELVREGKVRYIGASNLEGSQVAESELVARYTGTARFVSVQNEYSLLERRAEADVIPACLRLGVGLITYYPLASGLLTGKYRRGERAPAGSRLADAGSESELTPERFDALERLTACADALGRSLLELALGWLAAQGAVSSVIAGATAPEQVNANADAIAWVPAASDLALIHEALEHGHPRG
jgi:aryl-alcohol dehydrogenase-like predicted oxidoreductase